jgi:hypothetical protein
MSAANPSEAIEFNLAMREKIVALGAVPVVDVANLTQQDATNRLWRQLLFLLGGLGGGGMLYGIATVLAGFSVTISSFSFGPVNTGSGFGPLAFNSLSPVRKVIGQATGQFALNTPLLGPIFTAAIPPAALTPVGWIDSVALSGGGPAYGITVTTNALHPDGNTIIPFIFAGQAGILEITPDIVPVP